MKKLFEWIKNNKLTACLIAVVLFLLWRGFGGVSIVNRLPMAGYSSPSFQPLGAKTYAPSAGESSDIAVVENTAPSTMLLQETQASLQVKDVRDAAQKIITYAQGSGGFLVNSSLTRPQESPYGTIMVRIPSEKLDETMAYYRGLANKVVSENIQGRDVSKEYTDIDARLATLRATKTRLEDIFNRSGRIVDLLEAQREILNVQNQIDSYVGRKDYLEQSVKYTKITVYLSSDEFALPYAPSGTFNVSQAFKLAFRSMMITLSNVVTALIWVAVYLPLVAVAGAILFIGVKIYRKKQHSSVV